MPKATDAPSSPFHFQQFTIQQERCAMKVTSDAILLGAWAGRKEGQEILDIGSGTGVLAFMAAQLQPDASVVGVEIDSAAAQQAQENVAASPFVDRIRIESGPIQEHESKSRYDLIISNPPFFTGGVLNDSAEKTSVRHTVKLSHQDLLRAVQRLLSEDGQFCVLLPLIEGLRFVELAGSYQLHLWEQVSVRDQASKPVHRLLLSFGKKLPEEVVEKELLLHDGERRRQPDYAALVSDFYLP